MVTGRNRFGWTLWADRVLKDLENTGLIFAKGKTIVVFGTR